MKKKGTTILTVAELKELEKQGKIAKGKDGYVFVNNLPEFEIKQEKVVTPSLFKEDVPNEALFNFRPILKLLREKYAKQEAIWIPVNSPSLKNSKEIGQVYTGLSECCKAVYDKQTKICSKCHKTTKSGTRATLRASQTVMNYVEKVQNSFKVNKMLFKSLLNTKMKPYVIGVYFIRDSERRFDYTSALDTIQDCMTGNIFFSGKKDENKKKDIAWIDDDNANEVIPVLLGHHVDKQHPGCIITVLKEDYLNQLINFI